MTRDKDADLEEKISQAEYQLNNLRRSSDEDNLKECRADLAACLSAIRSVALYVRNWLEKGGKIRKGNDRDWLNIIEPWEKGLDASDYDQWRCAIGLRNEDIHIVPVSPEKKWRGGHFGSNHFGSNVFSGPFWGKTERLLVKHPTEDSELGIIPLCVTAIKVARILATEYKELSARLPPPRTP